MDVGKMNENELTTMVLQTSPDGTFCITNQKVVHSDDT